MNVIPETCRAHLIYYICWLCFLIVTVKSRIYVKLSLNFPCLCIYIPAASAYVVYISRLILYSRVSVSYYKIPERWLPLKREQLNQAFLVVKLRSSHRKMSGHHDLVDRNGIFVSQLTPDMFRVEITIRSCPHSWLITGFVARVTRRVRHVDQELIILLLHLRSPWYLVGFALLDH